MFCTSASHYLYCILVVLHPRCTWPGNAFATRESEANMRFPATLAGSACLAACTSNTAMAFVVTRASIRQHQHVAVGGGLASSKASLGVRRTGRKSTLGRRGGPSMMFDSLSESFTAITDLLKGQTTITESRSAPSVFHSLLVTLTVRLQSVVLPIRRLLSQRSCNLTRPLSSMTTQLYLVSYEGR